MQNAAFDTDSFKVACPSLSTHPCSLSRLLPSCVSFLRLLLEGARDLHGPVTICHNSSCLLIAAHMSLNPALSLYAGVLQVSSASDCQLTGIVDTLSSGLPSVSPLNSVLLPMSLFFFVFFVSLLRSSSLL